MKTTAGFLALGLGTLITLAVAQEQPASRPAVEEAVPAEEAPAKKSPAVEFLEKVEETNRELKTLHGSFKQLRENVMFSEEIHSTGEFWYTKPNFFRCDYHNPSPAQFFLVKDKGYFYSPENKQLDTFTLESGADAPINEMLVGFGLDVDKVLDVFSVRLSPEQPADTNLLKIDFISRDRNRTLDFQSITVTFDRTTYEPRTLLMQESEDTVKIDLQKVEKNVDIPSDTYATKFPEDVTVLSR